MKKLEIGPHSSGRTPDGDRPETWDTVDCHYNATYQCRWGYEPLPITGESYDIVHASHVLEHIPWWLTLYALKDVRRVLKPHGRLTVWVPDSIRIIQMAENDPEEFLRLEQSWPCGNLNPEKDPWVYMNARVFWGARPGELGQEHHFHRAMFGLNSLTAQFKKAGFGTVLKLERDATVWEGHGWMEVGVEGIK